MTRRRWIADEWNDTSAVLLHKQAQHLARVLRAQPGQEFDIVAGSSVRRGVVQTVHEDRVEFSLHENLEAAAPLPLTVALSIVRFERMEWAIEKLTELGVARVIPLIAQRSEKHLVQAAEKRVERWRKIARESAQQSRRSDVPEIGVPIPLPQCAAAVSESEDNVRLLLSERERAMSLRDCMQKSFSDPEESRPSTKEIYAAVGPEGGWTDAEMNIFTEHRWQPVSLGPRILRAETAAIAMASVLSSWLSA
ncbi:MAG: RsmE family RNA methyltransferase [Acidobacteriaceae bacterium]